MDQSDILVRFCLRFTVYYEMTVLKAIIASMIAASVFMAGGGIVFAQAATVTTQEVSSIAARSAVANGTIVNLGWPNPYQHGFCWNTTGSPSLADNISQEGRVYRTGPFNAQMDGLLPNTRYYVRAYASTYWFGTSYGDVVSFTTTTDPEVPIVSTQTVTDIDVETAIGHGLIIDVGDPPASQHGFCWNTTGMPTIDDDIVDIGIVTTEGEYTADLPGLTSGTVYYVRAYATNTDGTSYGEELSFQTLQPPAITTNQATDIGPDFATGHGTLDHIGIPAAQQHGVCWNTTGLPTLTDSKTEDGAPVGTGSFESVMTDLVPNTTYYMRTYATNTVDTVYGVAVSFTTAPMVPTVTTQAVSDIGETTATGNGNIDDLGIPNPSQHGVCWDTDPDPTITDSRTLEGPVSNTGPFLTSMTGLSPDTTYHVRAYATNTAGTVYGAEVSFTTSQQLPQVSTQDVTDIGVDSATGNGTITDLGIPNLTQHGVCWDTAPTPDISNSKSEEGSASIAGAFESKINGLAPDTTYFVRAYATNGAGTVYGNEVSFTTAPMFPTVTTHAVSDIVETTATGNGNIDDLGIPNPSQHGVCWDTDPDPTITDSRTLEGPVAGTGPFLTSMTGLSPDTIYYVRAYATNTAGTVYGAEVSFTTLPLAPEVTTDLITNIQVDTATAHGAIVVLGVPPAYQHGICWNMNGLPTLADNLTEEGIPVDTGPFESILTGLEANSIYFVRAYVTSEAGTSFGQEVVFGTSITMPIVTTQTVTNVGTHTATGHGTLVQLGSPAPDQHGICWSVEPEPNIDDINDSVSDLGPASGTGPFTVSMDGLLPYQTYYVRSFALNSAGTIYGDQEVFTTLAMGATVSTEPATDIEMNTATGHGTISDMGIPSPTQHGHCWNTGGTPTISDSKNELGPALKIGPFVSALTDLNPNTTYYVRSYAVNAAGTVYGNEISFFTNPLVTAITTEAVSDIGPSSATAYGAISHIGIPPPTQHGFCWNTNGMPTVDDNRTEAGLVQNVGPFSATLNGLSPNTTYYVRAYVSTHVGNSYANTVSFTTPAVLPTLITMDVSDISKNTAIGNGTLSDLGSPNPSQHGFCWNTDGQPTLEDNRIELGSASQPGAFSGQITGLLPNMNYHVRAFAINDAGIGYGNEVVFTTVSETSAPVATIQNSPPKLSSSSLYQIKIGGLGIVNYKYKLDDVPWSDSYAATELLTFELYQEGPHSLYVIGENSLGVWQAEDDATSATWILDTTPPSAILHNEPSGTIGPVAFDIAVGGLGVELFRYRLDQEPWSIIMPVSKMIRIPVLEAGAHRLDVIGADRSNNWQAAEASTSAIWQVDEMVPTAVLTNLPIKVTNKRSAAIQVLSPPSGIPIERYAFTLDAGQNWDTGDISQPITIDELSEGPHTICVNAFGNERWQDGADGISFTDHATCYSWRVDLSASNPPEIIAESMPYTEQTLSGLANTGSVKLSWAWTSTDEEEVLQRYRIWISDMPFEDTSIATVKELFCDIMPGPQGLTESFILNGLPYGIPYYFTVTAVDIAGNESGLSNMATVLVESDIPEIHNVELEDGGVTTDNAAEADIVVSGARFIASDHSNILRFESNSLVFDLLSQAGTENSLTSYIPLGMPTGTYRLRVINKNGISNLSAKSITIETAATPLPVVISVIPPIVPAGTQTELTISGLNFHNSPADVQLVAADGTTTPLQSINRINSNILKAVIDVPSEFPADRYDVRVLNTVSEYNEFSAAKVEIHNLETPEDPTGVVTTTGPIYVDGDALPVKTILKTDDRIEARTYLPRPVKIKVHLEPGTKFDFQNQDSDDTINHSGYIMPPRQVLPSDIVAGTFGSNAIQFFMGSNDLLWLGDDTSLFLTMEMILPNNVVAPTIYYVSSDGDLSLAGVAGKWRDIDINSGGTPLSVLQDIPKEGLTTYTYGLLLQHMSQYALGFELENDNGDFNDDYGLCFTYSISTNVDAIHVLFGWALVVAVFILLGALMPHYFRSTLLTYLSCISKTDSTLLSFINLSNLSLSSLFIFFQKRRSLSPKAKNANLKS